MSNIYILSGLGADSSVFDNIDFKNHSVIFHKWKYDDKCTCVKDYAKKLANEKNLEDAIIIGLSFGGMVATELAKIVNPKKLILISSAKTKKEIPIYYRFIGGMKLHKLVPTYFLKKANFITYWFFGVKEKSSKETLKNILVETDSKFLKWAIDKIVQWDNNSEYPDTIHIHGGQDKILPINYVRSNYRIEDGGHLMVIDRSEEVNMILKNIFNGLGTP